MATQRTLRSTRSTSAATTPSDRIDQISLPKTPPPGKKHHRSAKVNGKTATSVKVPSSRSSTVSKDTPSVASESNELSTLENGDNENEDDGMTYVHAPSSDHKDAGIVETTGSLPPKSSIEQSHEGNLSWTGPHATQSNDPNNPPEDAMEISQDFTHDNSRKGGNRKSFSSTAAESRAGYESNSDGSEEFDVADDDDNYDDVDDVSVASDDSAKFEAEVEKEILAAGEEAIDWDDENTYHYDESWAHGLYNLGHGDHSSNSVWDFDLFALDKELDLRMTISAPDLRSAPANFGHMGDDGWSTTASSSSRSSRRSRCAAPSGGRVRSADATPTPPARSDADDGNSTDEEDFTLSTVSSPGITLTRRSHATGRLADPKLITDSSPRRPQRGLPQLQRMPVDPNKAIAFSAPGPLGKRILFRPPPDRTYRWVDLRSSSSCDSSSTSSPTMINLEDAYLHGNTRTGAHITDIIHGSLFSALHCAQDPLPAVRTPSVSGFYRPLLEDIMQTDLLAEAENSERPTHDPALAFIDFSGGAEEQEDTDDDLTLEPKSSQEDGSPATTYGRRSVTPVPRAPLTPLVAESLIDDDAVMMDATPPSYNQRIQDHTMSGDQAAQQGLNLLLGPSSSPTKRRLSNRSNDRRSVSPAIKRPRFGAAGEVLV